MCAMCMLDTIREKRDAVYSLAHKYKGGNVFVFGSCARKEETPDSDIDFMMTFNGATLFDMEDLQKGLENLFGRKVDLLSSRVIRDDAFGRRVMHERVAV